MEFNEFIEKTDNKFENFVNLSLIQCVYLNITLNIERELTIEEKKELYEKLVQYVDISDYLSEQIAIEENEITDVIKKELSFVEEINI